MTLQKPGVFTDKVTDQFADDVVQSLNKLTLNETQRLAELPAAFSGSPLAILLTWPKAFPDALYDVVAKTSLRDQGVTWVYSSKTTTSVIATSNRALPFNDAVTFVAG